MKLRKLLRRTAAAAVAGAMALSFSAPALAAVPPLPMLTAAALSAENDASTTAYTVKVDENATKIEIDVDAAGNHTVKVNNAAQSVPDGCTAVIIDGTNAGGNTGFTLTVNAVSGKTANITLNDVYIQTSEDKALYVNGAVDITLKGTNTLKGSGYGIYSSSGTLTITGNGSLEAEGTKNGIYADKDIEISANVTARGTTELGDWDDHIYGIESLNTITIKSGTVNAIGGSSGIYGFDGITINDGTVNASGKFRGLFAREGNVSITGGTVTATGNWHGIYGNTDVEIKDAGVKASSINTNEGSTKTLSGTAKVVLTGGQRPDESWVTKDLNGRGTGWLLYDNGDGTVGSMPKGLATPSLSELQNSDPSTFQNKTLDYADYDITVRCGNDDSVKVTGANMNALPGGLKYDPDTNTLTGTSQINGDLTIEGNSAKPVNVNLEGGADAYFTVAGNLTVTNAENVTVTNGSRAINGDAEISCTGNVEIRSQGEKAVNGTLTYTNTGSEKVVRENTEFTQAVPQNGEWTDTSSASRITIEPEKAYRVTVKNGTAFDGTEEKVAFYEDQKVTIEADEFDAGNVFKNWKAVWKDADGEEHELTIGKDNTFTMPAGDVTITAVTEETLPVEPDEPGTDNPDPDFGVDPVDDGAGIAGAVVAGTLIGGAAVVGSYEIATRVILSELLPEGAAIPANRGELAMLVWQTAGKPEPAAQPAFTDVADAELAKAAQWCVEQGYLDAKDGKFSPNSWMPKFKTIEVWKKAFPKQ